ncbi:hypothetical protein [Myxococcus sp. CA040A]|uniref:hypothetical protein n=1 Tax=Myxococcus sp. CA040A TaxID=2741738 RepID=UPI00157A7877|nr:hypothetical protein [Myxococcus sp. CA040A]NTX01936.1 hypothetical protein [Myxococcus sp. CA040A]
MNIRRVCVAAAAVFSFSAGAEGVREPVSLVQADESAASLAKVCPAVPLSLTAINASSLEPARVAWNAGSNSGAWHYLDTINAYITPQCPATPVTIQAVLAKVADLNQGLPFPEDGIFTNRAGLSQSIFLSSNYYGNGLAVLAAIDAYAGGGEIQAWIATQEVPCHNCHEFYQYAVLYYPASRKVVVLQGYTGYDS